MEISDWLLPLFLERFDAVYFDFDRERIGMKSHSIVTLIAEESFNQLVLRIC